MKLLIDAIESTLISLLKTVKEEECINHLGTSVEFEVLKGELVDSSYQNSQK